MNSELEAILRRRRRKAEKPQADSSPAASSGDKKSPETQVMEDALKHPPPPPPPGLPPTKKSKPKKPQNESKVEEGVHDADPSGSVTNDLSSLEIQPTPPVSPLPEPTEQPEPDPIDASQQDAEPVENEGVDPEHRVPSNPVPTVEDPDIQNTPPISPPYSPADQSQEESQDTLHQHAEYVESGILEPEQLVFSQDTQSVGANNIETAGVEPASSGTVSSEPENVAGDDSSNLESLSPHQLLSVDTSPTNLVEGYEDSSDEEEIVVSAPAEAEHEERESSGSGSPIEREQSPVSDSLPVSTKAEVALHEGTNPVEPPPNRTAPNVWLRSWPLLEAPIEQITTNPLTSNVIVCVRESDNYVLREIDARSRSVVHSVPMLTQGIKHSMTDLYKHRLVRVSHVVSLAAGVQLEQKRDASVHVAALVAYEVLSNNETHTTQTKRVLVVLQWGSMAGQEATALKLVTKPPDSLFGYSPESLLTADGFCFFAGSVRGDAPCVLTCRQHDAWSSTKVGPSDCKITAMAVSPTNECYIAIALSDGSIGVWSYEDGLDGLKTSDKTGKNHILRKLYRLETAHTLVTPLATTSEQPSGQFDGYCTHLEWSPPDTFRGTSLLMLAVVFFDAVAVFHVPLPHLPETSNVAARCMRLDPFAVTRLSPHGGESNAVAWLHLGPHSNPFLASLCHGAEVELSRIALFTIEMSNYVDSAASTETPRRIFKVCEAPLPDTSRLTRDSLLSNLLGMHSIGSVAFYWDHELLLLSPALSTTKCFTEPEDPYFRSMRQPVTSEPLGLDSSGSVVSSGSGTKPDSLLSVFTTTECKLRSSGVLNLSDEDVGDAQEIRWDAPLHRHWLCRIYVGDSNEARDKVLPREQKASVMGYDENARGGSMTSILCELSCDSVTAFSGLRPHRITWCRHSGHCAVFFASSPGNSGSLSHVSVYPCVFALLDAEAESPPVVSHHKGRDLAFLSGEHGGASMALFLSEDGLYVHLLSGQSNVTGEVEWKESPGVRPFSGVSSVNEYCEGRRLLLLASDSKYHGLVLAGSRIRDSQTFVSRGQFIDNREVEDGFSMMLPNLKSDPVLWLKHGEDVVSFVALPEYKKSRRCIAIATHQRIMLVDLGTLEILAQTTASLPYGELVPIGSHTVSFCSTDSKVQYLCASRGKFSNGVLATLPSREGVYVPCSVLAVRPDRIVYSSVGSGVRLLYPEENEPILPAPIGLTKPSLCLEPLLANALCVHSSGFNVDEIVRVVTEKFGRKLKSLAHADGEGTGNKGSGLTPAVFENLSSHGFKDAASWLLTGDPRFERASNAKILPSWASMPSKAYGAPNVDAVLHLLANGDQYLSDYVQSPDRNMATSLPRASDPSSQFALEFARRAMREGNVEGCLKLLDFAGKDSSESDLLLLTLCLQIDPFSDIDGVLKGLSGCSMKENSNQLHFKGTTSVIAALALGLGTKQVDGHEPLRAVKRGDSGSLPLKQLAPSVQMGHEVQRARHRLVGENTCRLAVASQKQNIQNSQNILNATYNESLHVWNEGPFKEKENLLVLERFEEWLGRARPSILGKEGATVAFERGEKRLADILANAQNYDDDSFCGKSEDSKTKGNRWEKGIGEGRSDEDNLSAYFRMSEGADEDGAWKTEGLADLTTFQHKGNIIGDHESWSLQPTTSNVDLGESGKVKVLFDLACEKTCGGGSPCGMVVEAFRGGSLDVGILHQPENDARKKCSIEFWYHLPGQENVSEEIVLVRRSVSSSGEDLSACCVADDRSRCLWELVVLPSGELEYRSSAGSSLRSSRESSSPVELNATQTEFTGDSSQANERQGLVSWRREGGGGGWNHVCLVFSSRQYSDPSLCTVTIMMKGATVASEVTSVSLPGLSHEDLANRALVDDAMGRTALAFCINPVEGLRITDVRIWSCERSSDDCKMMMYEYLRVAEMKRKLKVKIRSKRKPFPSDEAPNGRTLGGLLAPPPRESAQVARGRRNLVSDSVEQFGLGNDVASFGEEASNLFSFVDDAKHHTESVESRNDQDLSSVEPAAPSASTSPLHSSSPESQRNNVDLMAPSQTNTSPSSMSAPLWTSGILLSDALRRSAAAALIRGPPATRHFGGNRGGLEHEIRTARSGTRRRGVGAIAICGAEKTVVFSHEKSPPGITYPIGASGAVISDEMDEEGSEFLCCFLAKDKRMLLFHLASRTLVVELQITAKLNFWRFLPPQAHGHTLAFMIVTPVGGFHWAPLEANSLPESVWRRGPDLQGKKVIAYEEGGSNGLSGADARSAVALLLASVNTANPVEAWVVPICGDSRGFCVSNNVMGAALCHPWNKQDGGFLPFVITATMDLESDIVVEVFPLVNEMPVGIVAIGEAVASVKLCLSQVHGLELNAPSLAMGTWPDVICCCCENVIVVAVRAKGLIAAYRFSGSSLELVFLEPIERFIVDAAVRASYADTTNARMEIVLLVNENDNPKDGRAISIFLD